MAENCPMSCRGEPEPPWRHAAKGKTVEVQHSTQTVRPDWERRRAQVPMMVKKTTNGDSRDLRPLIERRQQCWEASLCKDDPVNH